MIGYIRANGICPQHVDEEVQSFCHAVKEAVSSRNTMAAAPVNRLASAFRLLKQHKGCYTGGKVALSTNESFLVCLYSEDIQVLDIEKGEIIRTITAEEDGFMSFAIHPNDKELVTSGRSKLIKHWNLETGELIRAWKGMCHLRLASCNAILNALRFLTPPSIRPLSACAGCCCMRLHLCVLVFTICAVSPSPRPRHACH